MAEGNWYPKREARRFEPPPWEREQFEALQLQREEGAGEGAIAEAEAQPAVQAECEPEPAMVVPLEVVEPAPVPDAATEPEPARTGPAADAVPVEAMLVQLQAEEPRLDESVKTISLFASGIVLFLGVSIFGWGSLASMRARGNATAMAASMFLLVVGLGLAALGYWLGLRATKRQGD